jgi:hypothetical protein
MGGRRTPLLARQLTRGVERPWRWLCGRVRALEASQSRCQDDVAGATSPKSDSRLPPWSDHRR